MVCVIKNSATLAGSLFTLHVSQVHIDLPTLSDSDKEVISKWGAVNKIDFLSLSYTRHAKDVRDVRLFLHPSPLYNVCFLICKCLLSKLWLSCSLYHLFI